MIDPADLRDVFDRAASLPPVDRAAFLEHACGDNVPLRREVERLLAADARLGPVFDRSAGPSDDGGSAGAAEQSRTLAPGTHLGPYVVDAMVGAGGMGEVYRAHDTRLGRAVAIKVLPAALTRDFNARQRFEREARVVASLSHAHICPLFDIGRQDGRDYLVLEFLEGEMLATRLQRGKLPLRQALTFGTQIASALVVAHRASIVHRDLKPGNIMLTHEGAVLLDFGLARLAAQVSEDGATATLDSPITHTGVILGTVQYMAPEQLEGREVDARTDLFALGAVLYEMVTGRRPFTGSNTASLIGNILHADPPTIISIEAMSPPALDRVVRICLSKDPLDRWQTAVEVHARLEALQDVASDGHGTAGEDSSTSSSSPRGSKSIRPAGSKGALWRRRDVRLVAGSLIVAAAVGLMYRGVGPHAPNTADAPAQRTLTRLTDRIFGAFSPDASLIVLPGDGGLWVQPTAGGKPIRVTNGPDWSPDWSPDGTSIVFSRDGEGVFVVSPTGGDERHVAMPAGQSPMWSPDGRTILTESKPFGPTMRLYLGGLDQPPREVLASFLAGGEWMFPAWHPDGRLTIAGRHKTEGRGIYTVSVQDDRWVKTAVPEDWLAGSHIEQIYTLSWAPSGQFLYATCVARGVQNIWRLRMDPGLRITAIDRMTSGPGADWMPKVSRDGKKLQFSLITGNSQLWSFPFTASGDAVGPPQPLSEGDGEVNWASLSRDGRRLAYYYQPLNSVPRQSELRLSTVPFTDRVEKIPADRYVRMASAWSHRGNRLAVQAARISSTGSVTSNLLLIREPTGAERVIARCTSTEEAPCSLKPADWTADDAAVLLTSRLGNERRSRLALWTASVETPAEAPADSVLADSEWNISQGAYSPDGRWLAFAYGGEFRDEKGIAIVPGAGKVPRSAWRSIAAEFEELGNPLWSRDGRSLYFTGTHGTEGTRVWRVPVTPLTGAQAGPPVKLPTDWVVSRSYYPRIAVSADRLILPLNSQKAATWMLDNVDR